MLHHLQVQGFKSLRGVEVDLARLVVLFGPNAAGKSNFLESLVLLSRLVQERTLAEAFEAGIRGYPNEAFSFETGGVEELLSRDKASLLLRARLGIEGSRPEEAGEQLEYSVRVGIRPKTGDLQLEDELLQPLTAAGAKRVNPVIQRVDLEEGQRIRVRRSGKASRPFEERVGIHYTLASNLRYSGEEFPHFDALRKEVGAWHAVYLDPREAMRRSQPPREVEDVGERGELLVPFLHRLQEDPRHRPAFAAILRATRMIVPSLADVRTELVRSRGEIDLKVQQDGTWMSARVVSEGTLRVLALCAMAANPFRQGLVAFEEPENGVHPRRIQTITQILAAAARTRQVVVTTHSPLVVGEVVRQVRSGEIASSDVKLIVCSSTPGGTRLRPFDPKGPLFDDADVEDALMANDDAAKVQALLERGWLDG